MINRPVLFLDSGIGGIPYCRNFHSRNPNENIVYFADRKNFPYGNKKREELTGILTDLLKKLIVKIDPKIVVLACNTASIVSLCSLRDSFPELLIIGTVPAIKPAALTSKAGKIGVLGTELTINEPYIRELAEKFGGKEIIGIAAPELVEFIENKISSAAEEEKNKIAGSYLSRFRKAGVDSLVLGCTHFLFLLENFQNEALPDIDVFDSVAGITGRIETLLEKNSHNSKNYFLLNGTDEPEQAWTVWSDYLGFEFSMFKNDG